MASCVHSIPVSHAGRTAWRAVQAIGLVATGVLVVLLVVQPALALRVLWNAVIPVLPATFLIAPALWRGACPLATLNMWSNGRLRRAKLTAWQGTAAGLTGIVLLIVLAPARRFLFNENGPALAATIASVAAASLVLGALFDAKAGFCNGICPVLPVERLYGQHPLWHVANPRCGHCTLCVSHGCLDLAPALSFLHATGNGRHGHRWLASAYGAFAAAFPGFVAGFYTTADTTIDRAADVYVHVAAWAGASYLVTVLVVVGTGIRASVALTALAAIAAGLYYWFAAPLVATSWNGGDVVTVAIRCGAAALVGLWLWRAMSTTRANAQHAIA